VHGQWRMQRFWMSYGAFTTCPRGLCNMACCVLFLKIGIVERRFAGVFLNSAPIDANVPRKTPSYHWTVDNIYINVRWRLRYWRWWAEKKHASPPRSCLLAAKYYEFYSSVYQKRNSPRRRIRIIKSYFPEWYIYYNVLFI